MAIKKSGSLSLGEIQTEFGGSNDIRLTEYYAGRDYVPAGTFGYPGGIKTAIPSSGRIAISNFYGAARQYFITDSNIYSTPQSLRSVALSKGWNGSDTLVYTISTATGFSSNQTGAAALTVDGPFPNGVTIINNGVIVGMGGRGADQLNAGFPGGPALNVQTPVTITNNGAIAGGGGGGGAGTYWVWNGYNRSMPGSAGASGLTQSLGGVSVANLWNERRIRAWDSSDTNFDGLYEEPGPAFYWVWGGRSSSPGGKGGAYGQPGDAGGTIDGNYNYSGYAGGAAGAAVLGNSYVTWITTGNRAGPIVP